MRTLELFAGAGGLGLGMAKAGFRNAGVLEWDAYACDTIRLNKSRGHDLVQDWEVHQEDAKLFDFSRFSGKADVISGGPPCQPFSMGGKHRAFLDDRDMFPQAIRAVNETTPKAFIFENVRGLTRQSFRNYFAYILLQLEFPEIKIKQSEEWSDHLRRLERTKTSSIKQFSGLRYNVVYRVLNAADYGIPQKRERVFIVGFRSDLDVRWNFPLPSHSAHALAYSKWISGDYWREHRVAKKDIPIPSAAEKSVANQVISEESQRWRTVRDALKGLPDPRKRQFDSLNHLYQPGAKVYPGHTGSPIDEPAKTLKAGDHGVPGGENMLREMDGSVRYFSVRESARLQDFPDDYLFNGPWGRVMKQLGNAVPVGLAKIMADSIRDHLQKK